jgi:ribonuclease HII
VKYHCKLFNLQTSKLENYATTFQSSKIICGVDEAGRGCLAGPVVAAAVILPENFKNEILNDSKQLTEKQQQRIAYHH